MSDFFYEGIPEEELYIGTITAWACGITSNKRDLANKNIEVFGKMSDEKPVKMTYWTNDEDAANLAASIVCQSGLIKFLKAYIKKVFIKFRINNKLFLKRHKR